MQRLDSGNVVAIVGFVVEALVLGGLLLSGVAFLPAIVMSAVLLIVPSFVVGYFVKQFGFLYGLVLGFQPAILALAVVPVTFFGFSPIASGFVLLFAYIALSAFCGAAGQFYARRRNAA